MRRIIYSVLTMLMPVVANAQEQPIPLSLEDAMDYAVKHNVNVKNASLDAKIQKAQVGQTTAAAYPRINGKGDYTDYLNLPVQFFPGDFAQFIDPTAPPLPPGSFVPVRLMPKYAAGASVTGTQTIFDGSILVALQARNTILELSKKNVLLSEENIRYEITRAYYALVIAQKQLRLISTSLGTVRSMAHDLNVMRENGFVEKIEVDRTTVQVNNLATDSLTIANLLTVSEQLLKYQMGMNIYQPIQLIDTNLNETLNENTDLLTKDVEYDNRTEFGLLQTQLKLNEYDVKRYKLSALPSLSALGNVGYNYASNNFEDMVKFRKNYIFSSFIGLQLNVPIFNGLLRVNQLKEARFNVEKTKNNIENLKLSIDFQTEQSKTSYKNSLLKVQSQQENLDLASSVVDLAQKKYKAGVGSNLEVNQAQTDLIQAQNNYFNSLLDVINASADLKKALGQFK